MATANLSSALRCGECHGPIEVGWRESGHARSERSPLFVAMRQGADQADCDRCHAPLRGRVDPAMPGADEGVTCDVCHTMKVAEPSRRGPQLELALSDNVKLGTLCDAKNHYFHRMGCSPKHAEAAFCGNCHLYYRTTPAGVELPVFTEYEEWQHASSVVPCQDCHMPKFPGEVAVGAGPRPGVPEHGSSVSDDLRRTAVALDLSSSRVGDKLRVTATLKSQGAGHRLPTGLPGRQIVLRVRPVEADGHMGEAVERRYGRVLVDASGREVPFYLAEKLASDNRLAPGEVRVETFELRSTAKEVDAEVSWHALSPALAERFPTAQVEQRLLQVRVAVGAGKATAGPPRDSARGGGDP
jgi:hypothetical protein